MEGMTDTKDYVPCIGMVWLTCLVLVGCCIRLSSVRDIPLLSRQHHCKSNLSQTDIAWPLTLQPGRSHPTIHLEHAWIRRASRMDRRQFLPRQHLRPGLVQGLRRLRHQVSLHLQHHSLRGR